MPLAETPLQQLAFDPQHFGATSRHKYVGMTPYGLCEARYLMKGGYIAAGVPRAKVPGATLQSQIEHIFTADGSKEFVKEASEGDGFFCQHDEDGTVLTLPQGYIIAVAGWAQPEADKEAGPFGIRWSFVQPSSLEQLQLAAKTTEDMVSAYPELDDAGYTKFKAILLNYLIPAIAAATPTG